MPEFTKEQFFKEMEIVHTLADCVELYVLADNFADATFSRFHLTKKLEELQRTFLTPGVVASALDAEFTFTHK